MSSPKGEKVNNANNNAVKEVKKDKKVSSVSEDFNIAFANTWKSYVKQLNEDNRFKLIDIFCLFLVIIAAVQCTFMITIWDNFPFNAFLSGFIICVGQFVLLISLRLQLAESFAGISKNRAFGEFILASLILHFICLHFIN
ncbi:hypothetical protein Kpol_505p2 [Vanderwaltozyma polyspora DSM 70294]|uniref:Dolichyl-diphosphooligosaccharide--protein glycosyltransferase subunit OST2 n=1 Tax=Vanderwaltozyma polyspora (strain ATCC 22028 / DSM 70294 / BCRC 21397 / CBS 2163 / NBRC 10782 / NRRL Y-8283 / UCD 57-17) TaxID=436907 RepID=A7TN94_VANPO|nr:uncharacterized protein Kpol_505p2 [Vanderwaltozyma polyspora DSM 70294]EDO16226.1 hypothetical protein Kpol_505p2 [Vanderwaltozyma polyspora DSM 70294]